MGIDNIMKCKHCNSKKTVIIKKGSEKAPLTGLYCGDCGRYIKFLSKYEILAYEMRKRVKDGLKTTEVPIIKNIEHKNIWDSEKLLANIVKKNSSDKIAIKEVKRTTGYIVYDYIDIRNYKSNSTPTTKGITIPCYLIDRVIEVLVDYQINKNIGKGKS